ncbi:MAG: hypothetical protein EON87_15855 [Brevundimonas sp.]|nr:MAG: hypothetical protein EON87_15855 [Brevundimonas sp.]
MKRLAALFGALMLAAPSVGVAQDAAPDAVTPIDCPASVGREVRCLSGRDANGAWYVIAMPTTWNRKLIVHTHGGPRMGDPEAPDSLEDLDRFAIMVRQGYAWIGSTYRRGGYGVRMAAEDADNSRKIFWARFGRPDRTILHGQSWGGNVAAKAAELYALDSDGRPNYDGVLLTNGVLMGGTRAYQFRAVATGPARGPDAAAARHPGGDRHRGRRTGRPYELGHLPVPGSGAETAGRTEPVRQQRDGLQRLLERRGPERGSRAVPRRSARGGASGL